MTDNAMILDMLGDQLRDAVVAARARVSDPSIMARIGDSPDPGVSMRGLVSIEREGHATVYGLSDPDAIDALAALV